MFGGSPEILEIMAHGVFKLFYQRQCYFLLLKSICQENSFWWIVFQISLAYLFLRNLSLSFVHDFIYSIYADYYANDFHKIMKITSLCFNIKISVRLNEMF